MKFDLAAMIRRAGRTRQKVVVAPRLEPPVAFRSMLENVYLRVVRQWGRELLERIMPVYERTLGEGIRDTAEDVEGAVDETDRELTRLVLSLDASLEDWVVRVELWHRGRFSKSFTPLGVNLDTMLGQGDVRTTLRAVLAENLSLIRSLNDQMRNGIGGAVFRGLTARATAAEVARDIRKITGMARRRAELIAADQLQKLTGRLDQERQEQAGLDKFQWAHSRKRHPRPHHKARDGKVFKWKSDVGRNDPPGRAIRCGCRARAVVEL